jgi:putative FmdB family regulatory protein
MPMYDYHCRSCNHEFEELIYSSAESDEDIVCPECNTNNSERLLSAPAISTGPERRTHSVSNGCSAPSGFS